MKYANIEGVKSIIVNLKILKDGDIEAHAPKDCNILDVQILYIKEYEFPIKIIYLYYTMKRI